jgi:DNA polymerase
MNKQLWIDTETFSPVPIKFGSHRYAEEAEVMLFAYAIADGPVGCVDLTAGERFPDDLQSALADPEYEIWTHNGGGFDMPVLVKTGIFSIDLLPRLRDTMVQAFAHGLPGSLDKLGEILKLDTNAQKLKEGKALINLFCKPLPKNNKLRRATHETHPEKWAEFIEYAKQDIVAMREVHKKLPKWNYPNNELELSHWRRNLAFNYRGFLVDTDLARAAVVASEKAKESLADQVSEATNGDVEAATQRDKLLAHILAEYGVSLPDMKKSTIERRANDPSLPSSLRFLLQMRLESSMTSVSKYTALLNSVSSDGRLRGTIQHLGAQRTGRDAARLFQPQNMKSPDGALMAAEMGAEKVNKEVQRRYIETGVDALKAGTADLEFSNVMGLTANLVRSTIIVPKGKKMPVADLSNIEGRVLAWQAGEKWKLKAFREYDAGTGPDLYVMTYARGFGVSIEEALSDKAFRKQGKVMDLAGGFEGGVGAYLTMSLTLGIDIEELKRDVFAALNKIDEEIKEGSQRFWKWAEQNKRTLGLERDIFIAFDILKRVWRAAHPATEAYWFNVKNAVMQAINSTGTVITVNHVRIVRKGAWLRVVLPSGRSLCYPSPRVEEGKISYAGVNQYSRQWGRINSYGGKFVENFTQAIARDVLKHGEELAEAAGYKILIPIHDELLTETPDTDDYSAEGLGTLMATNPPWAPDLPLSAAGFETYRYYKEL